MRQLVQSKQLFFGLPRYLQVQKEDLKVRQFSNKYFFKHLQVRNNSRSLPVFVKINKCLRHEFSNLAKRRVSVIKFIISDVQSTIH
jgi:hypothetical protein